MNKRIQELMTQAGYSFDPISGWPVVTYSASPEKLAEFIIEECINKIESKRSSGENTDAWTITRDMCYHDMMKELKEHFGVK